MDERERGLQDAEVNYRQQLWFRNAVCQIMKIFDVQSMYIYYLCQEFLRIFVKQSVTKYTAVYPYFPNERKKKCVRNQ